MVRKEGNLYVLDLCVKVAAVAPALIKYKPIEVDTITQVADGRGRRKRGTLDCSKPFFDGRRSERGRQVQASRNSNTTK